MGLKIKSFRDLTRNMIDWIVQNTSKLVDFSPGSAIRSIIEAVASELEEYYYRMYKNFNWAVENSVYEAFSFKRREATPAFGEVVLTFSYPLLEEITIPAGTTFTTSTRYMSDVPLYFETRQPYTVSVDSEKATLVVYCTEPGEIGNVAPDTITVMVNPINYVSTVTNPERFLSGRNAETMSERKQRFTKYVDTRARGTKAAIEYGTMEVEGVAGVYVDDEQVGIVNVYAHDASGNLHDDLREKIIENLENYRSAGIPVFVMPINTREIDVEITVTVLQQFNNESFKHYLKTAVENYLNHYTTSQSLYLSDLNAYVRRINEIAIRNCKISTPREDVVILPYELIRSGEIAVILETQRI